MTNKQTPRKTSTSLRFVRGYNVLVCNQPLRPNPVSCPQQPTAGKVTVDLSSHWPCVHILCDISTYGLNRWSLPITVMGMAHTTFVPFTATSDPGELITLLLLIAQPTKYSVLWKVLRGCRICMTFRTRTNSFWCAPTTLWYACTEVHLFQSIITLRPITMIVIIKQPGIERVQARTR